MRPLPASAVDRVGLSLPVRPLLALLGSQPWLQRSEAYPQTPQTAGAMADCRSADFHIRGRNPDSAYQLLSFNILAPTSASLLFGLA